MITADELNEKLFCHKDIVDTYMHNDYQYNKDDYSHYFWEPSKYTNTIYTPYANAFAGPELISKINVEYDVFPSKNDFIKPDTNYCFKDTNRTDSNGSLDIDDAHSLSSDCLNYCHYASKYNFLNTGIYDMQFCSKIPDGTDGTDGDGTDGTNNSILFDINNCLEQDDIVNRCRHIVDFANKINTTKFNHFFEEKDVDGEKKYQVRLNETKFYEDLDLSSWKKGELDYNDVPQPLRACPRTEPLKEYISYVPKNSIESRENIQTSGVNSLLSMLFSGIQYVIGTSFALVNAVALYSLSGLVDLEIVNPGSIEAAASTVGTALSSALLPLQYLFNELIMPLATDVLLFGKSKILNLVYGICSLQPQLKVYHTFSLVDMFQRYFRNATEATQFAVPFSIFNNHILKQIAIIVNDLYRYLGHKLYYTSASLMHAFAELKKYVISMLDVKILYILASTAIATSISCLVSFPLILFSQILTVLFYTLSFLRIFYYRGPVSFLPLIHFLFQQTIQNKLMRYVVFQLGIITSWLIYSIAVINPIISRVHDAMIQNSSDNNFFTRQKGRVQKLVYYTLIFLEATTILSSVLEPLIIVRAS